MSTTQSPTQDPTQPSVPTLTNVGTRPRTTHKLFVNIPVSDLQRSITFFEALGFNFNRQFTDASATCMLVGEDAYFMLLTRDRFMSFTKRPIGDTQREDSALFSLSVNSREDVDDMVYRATAAGGRSVGDPEDHGFMYEWSFRDPDGHGFGVFWMDPGFVQE